jgi:hypothetical protein
VSVAAYVVGSLKTPPAPEQSTHAKLAGGPIDCADSASQHRK